MAKLSLLFPIRGRRLHVFHKSVKDWLVDAQREDEMCYVDVDKVHAAMGRKCQELWRTMEYGLKHVVTHLCAGGLSKQARDLMFVFEWLLKRAKLGPPHALVQDGNRVAREHKDRGFGLLHSALRLMQSGLGLMQSGLIQPIPVVFLEPTGAFFFAPGKLAAAIE